jgi:hypothetical protein
MLRKTYLVFYTPGTYPTSSFWQARMDIVFIYFCVCQTMLLSIGFSCFTCEVFCRYFPLCNEDPAFTQKETATLSFNEYWLIFHT